MKLIYLECGMGAAGDMLTAALYQLLPDGAAFLDKINSLGIPGVKVSAKRVSKLGIDAAQISVSIDGAEEESRDFHEHHHHEHEHHHDHPHEHDHAPEHHHHDHEHHHHTTIQDIENLINGLDLSPQVRENSLAVYRLIAEAESAAHGTAVEQIHFHEVGAMDAVADIVGVCLLMEMLAPEKVVVSPVCTGKGYVKCAHGVLPVPAPAAAYLLKDIPIYSGDTEGELCTPTGAALLKFFADSFGDMPVMKTEKIAYGAGKKEFEKMNCVRAFMGETADSPEQILSISCNLDDMSAEAVGFAQEILLENGALDVFTTAIGMKKSRPGTMLTCLCRLSDRERMENLIFRHTSTIGIREHICERRVLKREETLTPTKYGDVRVKTSCGYGVTRRKAEYDDLARIAKENGITLEDAEKIIENILEK